MRSSLPFLLCSMLAGALHAQSGGTRASAPLPTVKWILGEKRDITTEITLRYILHDTVVMDVQGKSERTMAVVDGDKDSYTISLHTVQESDPMSDAAMQLHRPVPMGREGVMDEPRRVLRAAHQPLLALDQRYKISRAGKVLESLESDAARDQAKDAMHADLVDLLQHRPEGRPGTQWETDQLANTMADSIYNAFTAAQLADLQRILAPLALSFPAGPSVRQPGTVPEVALPLLPAMQDLPVMTEVGVDEMDDKTMTGRVVVTYDPKALSAALTAADPAHPVAPDGLALKEETTYTFDRSTGWLTASSSEITYRDKGSRMVAHVRCTLKPAKP